jgi:hypothetical protein
MTEDKQPGWLPNGKFNVRVAGLSVLVQRQIHPDDPEVLDVIRQAYPDLPAHLYLLIQEAMGELWRFVEWGEGLPGEGR